jgi:hypothetical protein
MPDEVINPYASPAILPVFEHDDQEAYRVRREGFHLVIEKGSRMPPICLKSGQPAEHWVRCPLTTSFADRQLHSLSELIPGLLLLFRFLNQLEYLEVGLSDAEYRKRRRQQIRGGILAIVSTLLTIPALAYSLTMAYSDAGALTFTAALCIGPTIAVFGLAMISNTKLIYVKQVTPTHIWFTGPLRPVLDQFPGPADEPKQHPAIRTPLILPDDWPLFEGMGIWRSGVHLVMRKDANFPDVCLRTGEPALRTIRVRHSFWGLHQTLSFGLSDALYVSWQRNRWGLLCGLALSLLGVSLTCIGAWQDIGGPHSTALSTRGDDTPSAGIMIAFAGLIVALVFWSKSRLVMVKLVNRDLVWLIGFSQQVLAMFPEWPGERQSPP